MSVTVPGDPHKRQIPQTLATEEDVQSLFRTLWLTVSDVVALKGGGPAASSVTSLSEIRGVATAAARREVKRALTQIDDRVVEAIERARTSGILTSPPSLLHRRPGLAPVRLEWDAVSNAWASRVEGDRVRPFAVRDGVLQTALNAELWSGRKFGEYLDQPVRQADSVRFARVGVGQAPSTHALGVTGSSRLTGMAHFDTGVQSPGFVSGVLGTGWRIDTASGALEIDNITVRDTLRTHVFKKDIVRVANGYLLLTDGTTVSQDTDVPGDGSEFTLYLAEPMFSDGDLVWLKDVDASGQVSGVKMTVVAPPDFTNGDAVERSVGADSVTDPEAQPTTVYRYRVSVASGGSTTETRVRVKAGATVARVSGSHMLLDASSTYAPFIDFYNGVTTWADFGDADKLKSRVGRLDGAYDYSGGDNAYGMAAGPRTGNWFSIDDTQGFRLMQGSTEVTALSGSQFVFGAASTYPVRWDAAAGTFTFGGGGSAHNMTWDASTGQLTLLGNLQIINTEGNPESVKSYVDNAAFDNSDIDVRARIFNADPPPAQAGLFINGSYLGYHDGAGNWKTYMDSQGDFFLGGSTLGSQGLTWDHSTNNLQIAGTMTIVNRGSMPLSEFDNDAGWTDDTQANSALTKASNALALLDGQLTTYVQDEDPATPAGGSNTPAEGDFWVDTNGTATEGDDVAWVWRSGAWVLAGDNSLIRAILDAQTAQTTADGKVEFYASPTQPAGGSEGDLWLDTDSDPANHLYRHNGTTWVSMRDAYIDAAATQAYNDAVGAANGYTDGKLDGKITTYYQDTAPAQKETGDLWFDTTAGSGRLYRWSGTVWEEILDQGIVDAAAAAADAQAAADRKIQTFYAPTGPADDQANDLGVGDLWFETDNDNLLHRWDGSAWVGVRDGFIQTAADDAAASALATAKDYTDGAVDGKVTTYYQNEAPLTADQGDLWWDTDDDKLYRYDSAATPQWVPIQDADIAAAIGAAEGAQSTADGKIVSFFQDEPPVGTAIGDLWFDTNNGNKAHRWDGTAWVSVRDADIDTALTNAGTAITAAAGAQATADGKVTTFYQDDEPVGSADGDLWMDTNDGNKLYRYDLATTTWIQVQDAAIQQAIADAQNAQTTADGKIQAFYVPEPPVDGAADPSGGTYDLGEGDLWFDTDDANHLYIYTSGTWTDARDGYIDDAVATGFADALAQANAYTDAAADGLVTTYYATDAPVDGAQIPGEAVGVNYELGVGDLWFDTDDKRAHRYDGTAWEELLDSGITNALDAAQDAQTTADGKIRSFYQTTAPVRTGPDAKGRYTVDEGDLWIDISLYDHDGDTNTAEIPRNELHRYKVGTGWVSVADARLDEIAADLADTVGNLSTLEDKVDGKVSTYYQTTEPTTGEYPDLGEGDLWLDTTPDAGPNSDQPRNLLYQYRSAATPKWQPIQDAGVVQAIADAQSAKTTADRKIVTFYNAVEPAQGTEPNGDPTIGEGDLWIDTANKNQLSRYDGANWVLVRDEGIEEAFELADYARALADGEIDVYYDTVEPVAGAGSYPVTFDYGDYWVDTDAAAPEAALPGALFQWDGTAWVAASYDSVGGQLIRAQTAQATADGKVKTFFGPGPVTAEALGDLWYDTSVTPSVLKRWNGSIWEGTATNGASWDDTLTDIPVRFGNAPDGAGLYLTADYLGYHDGDANVAAGWRTYISNTGEMYLSAAAGGDSLTWGYDGTTGAGVLQIQGTLRVASGETVEQVASSSAASAAQNAQEEAQNNLASRLGYTDYDDLVAEATAGKTIISGGYLRTSLIQADAITTTHIAAGAVTTNELNFTPTDATNVVATINASSEDGSLVISGSRIKIDGTVTFGTGYSPDEVQNAAVTTAGTNADTKVSASKTEMAQRLGYTDYAALEAAATAGDTIIDGGSIRTSLIQVDNLAAIKADLGAVTAGSIVVGGATNKLWFNDGADGAIHVGGLTKASAPAKILADGSIEATKISISGSAVNADAVMENVVFRDGLRSEALTTRTVGGFDPDTKEATTYEVAGDPYFSIDGVSGAVAIRQGSIQMGIVGPEDAPIGRTRQTGRPYGRHRFEVDTTGEAWVKHLSVTSVLAGTNAAARYGLEIWDHDGSLEPDPQGWIIYHNPVDQADWATWDPAWNRQAKADYFTSRRRTGSKLVFQFQDPHEYRFGVDGTYNTGDDIPFGGTAMELTMDGDLLLTGNLRLGQSAWGTPDAGEIRWSGTNFQGYTGSSWVDLDRGNTASDGAAVAWSNVASRPTITFTGNITGSVDLAAGSLSNVSLTVVESDKLDGQHGAYYQNASNLNAGTVADARLPSTAVRTSYTLTAGTGIATIGDLSSPRTIGLTGQAAAIHNLGTSGLVARTASNTFAARTLTGPAAGLTITNGNGISGDPTIALAHDLAALEGLGSTGFAVRTGTNTWAQRSITVGATNGLTVTYGNGVSGNPVIDLPQGLRTIDTPQFAEGTLNAQVALLSRFGTVSATPPAGKDDWNDVDNTRPGGGKYLLRGDQANGPAPGDSSYFHPFNLEYSSKTGAGNLTQLAFPYAGGASDGVWLRTRYSGTWSSWDEIWTSATDGPGSGLDADLWDGYQFSDYLNQAVKTTSSPTFGSVTLTAGLRSHAGTSTSGTAHLHLRGAANGDRWIFGLHTSESTGNAGSDLRLWRYSDTGTFLDTALWIERATGKVTINGPILGQSTLTAIGNARFDGGVVVDTDGDIEAKRFAVTRLGGLDQSFQIGVEDSGVRLRSRQDEDTYVGAVRIDQECAVNSNWRTPLNVHHEWSKPHIYLGYSGADWKVGVNRSTEPTYTLDVAGTLRSTDAAYFNNGATVTAGGLSVTGSTYLNNALNVTGITTLGDQLRIDATTDGPITLNKIGTLPSTWHYINWSHLGARQWYTGRDASNNFVITADGADMTKSVVLTAGGGLEIPMGSVRANGGLTVGTSGTNANSVFHGDLLPGTAYKHNIGATNNKWLTGHLAELWVSTLVASEERSTVGGRFNVGLATTLGADLTTGATTITVKHNNLNNGDVIHLEARGQLEFMKVTSGYGGTSGAYTYTVTRNLDGTGANSWNKGDGVFNTGTVGSQFIDLTAQNSLTTGQSIGGAALTVFERTGTVYSDIAPRLRLGQLNGSYDYLTSANGLAAGDVSGAWFSIDTAKGLRFMQGSTPVATVKDGVFTGYRFRAIHDAYAGFRQRPTNHYPLTANDVDQITARRATKLVGHRFYPGGGPYGLGFVEVSDNATNLVDTTYAFEGTQAGWGSDSGTVSGGDTSVLYNGRPTLKAVPNASSRVNPYLGGAVKFKTHAASEKFTVSVLARRSDGLPVLANAAYIYRVSNVDSVISDVKARHVGGGWYRLTATVVDVAASTVDLIGFSFDSVITGDPNGAPDYYSLAEWQLTSLGYPTTYTAPAESRPHGELEVPLALSGAEGTLSFWLWSPTDGDADSDTISNPVVRHEYIGTCHNSDTYQTWAYYMSGDGFTWLTRGSDVAHPNYEAGADITVSGLSRGRWIHVVTTWSVRAGTKQISIYDPLDGAVRTSSGTLSRALAHESKFVAGINGGPGYSTDNAYAEITALPYAMTLAEAAEYHQYTAPPRPTGAESYLDATKLVTGRVQNQAQTSYFDLDAGTMALGATFRYDGTDLFVGDTTKSYLKAGGTDLSFYSGGRTTDDDVRITPNEVRIGQYKTGQYNTRVSNAGVVFRDYTTELAWIKGSEITMGQVGSEHVRITPTDIDFMDGATSHLNMKAGVIRVGKASSSNIQIDSVSNQITFSNVNGALAYVNSSGFAFGERMNWNGSTFTFAGWTATDTTIQSINSSHYLSLNSNYSGAPALLIGWDGTVGTETDGSNWITLGGTTYLKTALGQFTSTGANGSGGGLAINVDGKAVFMAGKRGSVSGAAIAGWSFDDTRLYKTTVEINSALNSGTIRLGSSASSITATANTGVYLDGTGKFRVGTATSGSNYLYFDGSGLTIKAGTFDLSAANAKVSGTSGWFGASNVLSWSGSAVTMGGWTVDSDSIYTGSKTTSDVFATSGLTLASTGAIRSREFLLKADGAAEFKGKLTAPTGTIGGWTLSGIELSSGDLKLDSTPVSGGIKHTSAYHLKNDGTFELGGGVIKGIKKTDGTYSVRFAPDAQISLQTSNLAIGAAGEFGDLTAFGRPGARGVATDVIWYDPAHPSLFDTNVRTAADGYASIHPTHKFGAPGVFLLDSYSDLSTTLGSEVIPVARSKAYRFSAYARNFGSAGNSSIYLGVQNLDADKNTISPYMLYWQGGTTLAQALNPGDTTIYLTNASGFYNGATGHQRSIGVYGYTNSFGTVYPDYTYTRHYMADCYNAGAVNTTAHTITLKSGWTGPARPAGAAIGNHQSGGSYQYILFSNRVLSSDAWDYAEAEMLGWSAPATLGTSTAWRYGTEYVRIMALPNYNQQGAASLGLYRQGLANIRLEDVTGAKEVYDGIGQARGSFLSGKYIYGPTIVAGPTNIGMTDKVHIGDLSPLGTQFAGKTGIYNGPGQWWTPAGLSVSGSGALGSLISGDAIRTGALRLRWQEPFSSAAETAANWKSYGDANFFYQTTGQVQLKGTSAGWTHRVSAKEPVTDGNPITFSRARGAQAEFVVTPTTTDGGSRFMVGWAIDDPSSSFAIQEHSCYVNNDRLEVYEYSTSKSTGFATFQLNKGPVIVKVSLLPGGGAFYEGWQDGLKLGTFTTSTGTTAKLVPSISWYGTSGLQTIQAVSVDPEPSFSARGGVSATLVRAEDIFAENITISNNLQTSDGQFKFGKGVSGALHGLVLGGNDYLLSDRTFSIGGGDVTYDGTTTKFKGKLEGVTGSFTSLSVLEKLTLGSGVTLNYGGGAGYITLGLPANQLKVGNINFDDASFVQIIPAANQAALQYEDTAEVNYTQNKYTTGGQATSADTVDQVVWTSDNTTFDNNTFRLQVAGRLQEATAVPTPSSVEGSVTAEAKVTVTLELLDYDDVVQYTTNQVITVASNSTNDFNVTFADVVAGVGIEIARVTVNCYAYANAQGDSISHNQVRNWHASALARVDSVQLFRKEQTSTEQFISPYGISYSAPGSKIIKLDQALGKVEATVISQVSDARFKTDVIDVEDTLELVREMRPRTFNWAADGRGDVGFIAQELQTTLPVAVHKDRHTGTLSVSTLPVLAVAIGAIQVLATDNDRLRDALHEAEDRLARLEAAVFGS